VDVKKIMDGKRRRMTMTMRGDERKMKKRGVCVKLTRMRECKMKMKTGA
jgi:hypothetical protein